MAQLTGKALDTEKVRSYFPNLDGLRGIAVSLVVAWHIELHKPLFGFKQFFFNDIGFIGVTIFFILSGFLITYTLINEKTAKQKINFKAFYIRRVLRIWPLYLTTLLFFFVIYPRGMDTGTFAMCLLFLPNLALMLGKLNIFTQQIWSIGVEEQFYLLLPQFFRIKSKRATLVALVILTMLITVTKQLCLSMGDHHFFAVLGQYLYFFRIDQLLLGGIGAMVLYYHVNADSQKKQRINLSILFSKMAQILFWTYFLGHMLFGDNLYGIFKNSSLFAFVTVLIVINLSVNTSIVNLNNALFRYLGKTSYGIYLLHNLILVSVFTIMQSYIGALNPILVNLIAYPCIFALSVWVAGLSYRYFESYFLNLKARFTVVPKV